MNPMLALLMLVVVVVAVTRGLDARAARRARPDVAGDYLAESGAEPPVTYPLPRWLAALVMFAAAFGAVAAGAALRSTTVDERQDRSDRIASCRASFTVELATGPTTLSLKALADHGPDSDEFRQATKTADPRRLVELNKLSRTNPAEFLRQCETADDN